MTLAAWQAGLAAEVLAGAANTSVPETGTADSGGALSEAERRWLRHVLSSAGFRMTCEVQRWWREFRVQSAAPLTLSVLDAGRRAALIAEYVRRHTRPSSFVVREALPFLDLAAELAADVPHLLSLVAFERAMLQVGEAHASGVSVDEGAELQPWDVLTTHPLAEVVRFEAPPAQVLAAASRGLPPPSPGASAYWILIAPGLPNLARASSEAEATLFVTLRANPGHVARLRSDVGSAALLAELWQAGALRRE